MVELFSKLGARFSSFCECYYGKIQEGGAPEAPLIPLVQGRESVSVREISVGDTPFEAILKHLMFRTPSSLIAPARSFSLFVCSLLYLAEPY